MNPIHGAGPPKRVDVPDAVDLSQNGVRLHLDPTAMLWARDAKLDLRKIVRASIVQIDDALDVPSVDVSISAGSYFAIPDVGIGGFTDPVTGNVTISMDSQTPLGLPELINDWIPLTLAHELHHSKRVIDGPGYGATLLEAFVTEGSAEAFVLETYPNGPRPPWVESLEPDVAHEVWAKARDLLDHRDNAQFHQAWFFGGAEVPRWAGYKIGFAIAISYLEKHPGTSAAALAGMEAEKIYSESGYDPG